MNNVSLQDSFIHMIAENPIPSELFKKILDYYRMRLEYWVADLYYFGDGKIYTGADEWLSGSAITFDTLINSAEKYP